MNEKRKSILFLSKFSRNLKFVLVGSLICGLVIGVVRANIVIHANQYLQNSLYYLSLQILQNSIINSIASIFIILTFVNLAITFGEKGLFIDLLLLLLMYLLFLLNVLRRNLLFIAHPHCFLLLPVGLCGIIFLLHISTKLKKILLFFDKLISRESVIILAGTILIVLIIYNRSIYFFKNINRSKGPNIVLISIDALRPDHLSCYGYHRNTSPNIDQLAREGTIFKNGFSQACSTIASHSSIFLSQYPWTHEVVGSEKKMGKSSITLAEILKNQNYITAGFVGSAYISLTYGFDQGFDFFFDRINTWRTIKFHKNNLFRWLEKVKDKKFFLFLHTYDVHSPYDPLMPYRAFYTGDYSDQRRLNKLVDYKLTALNLSPEEIEYLIALYDAGINYVDDEIGELVKKLKKHNIFNNSVIIITADHGERLGERRGRFGHGGEASRIVTHVPLIMKIPGIGQGKVIEEIVESIDITPTILDILDISPPEGMQGKSILPLIKGSATETNFVAYTSEGREKANLSRAIRTKEWTYIMNHKGPDELYDRINDPKEQNNILKKKPLIAQKLKEELEDFIALTSEGKPQVAEKVDIDEGLKEQLKSLGYLH